MEKITLKLAALAAERAYRRGFQQGVNAANKFGVTDEDARIYRYERTDEKPYQAPELYADGKIRIGHTMGLTLVDRLLMENPELKGE